MKSLVLYMATSLILIVAMVPIANPNPVQATAGVRQWCWTDAEFSKICSDTKADCQASIPRIALVQQPCHVAIVNVQWCWTDKESTHHCFDSARECAADQPEGRLLHDPPAALCHKVSL
jgi:hypothetical protein